MLFLSRIHPVKGLLNLLRAWHAECPGDTWRLVLAGPDENGHQTEVESLAKALGVIDQLEFVGAVDDDEKWQLYRNADLLVLPSFTENFGIVVAEALAAGLPVITTTATPWRALRQDRLGWWCEPTVPGISQALREAFSLSDAERCEMGERAEVWAKERFGWSSVGEQILEFYQWMLDGGERPAFVQVV